MLILYFKPNCVFCRQVFAAIDRMELEVDRRDIEADSAYEDAVLEHGGKRSVPYLVDEERDVAMYDSEAIVKYLQVTYGGIPSSVVTRPRVHIGGSVCESCEG